MGWVQKNKSKASMIGGAVLVIIILLAMRGGHEQEVSGNADQAIAQVSTASVQSLEVAVLKESPGTVSPRMQADIAAKIMSTVSNVYVREGERVSAGQLLLRLEASDLAAQRAQAAAEVESARTRISTAETAAQLQRAQSGVEIASAKAALKIAREQLAIAKTGARPQERNQARLAVIQAEAQARNAETDYNRMKRLFEQDVIPRQRLDSAQTAYEVAQAQLESAKEQANLVEEGSRLEDIRSAEERVRQAEEGLRLAQAAAAQIKIRTEEARMAKAQASGAEAALELAGVQEGYSVIRAPISGLVTRRMVDPGDMVAPGVPLLAVEEDKNYRLEATVPESYARGLHAGKEVEIRVDAVGDTWIKSRVGQVLPSADRNSRTFIVKADIPAGVHVRSGEFGRIRFSTGKETGLFVRSSAIVERDGLTGAYVVDQSGHASFRLVKVGKPGDGLARVLSGLNAQDRVVTSGVDTLADGARVR